ncbi:MAG TPA: hypothetical protein VFT67_10150 [Jatrophihabitantaceae bacterium]|jgi:hypothetical protein|nr:hypothetical protein [Jatrophihabitantaceae bacterium]
MALLIAVVLILSAAVGAGELVRLVITRMLTATTTPQRVRVRGDV